MKILGIETSCDETAAAIVQDGTKILSNVVASSQDLHTKTGGIVPENAARQQTNSIIPVIDKAISDSLLSTGHGKGERTVGPRQLAVDNVDAIAVVVGPGLIGSLLVGVETAKALAFLWNKPIVPVNHLGAHIYANWIFSNHEEPKFPLLALVVSGGHTDLVLMKNHGAVKWIGGTRDDAAGEAFDKCARLLGLPYPGGPSISAKAEREILRQAQDDKAGLKSLSASSNSKLDMFPRPMIKSDNFDFSFSGLKTAVLNRLTDQPINRSTVPKYAAEVQEAIVDSLAVKSVRAIEAYKPKSFLLSGGVAANKRLRDKLEAAVEKQNGLEFHVPPPALCTDNAAMVASAAFYNYSPTSWKKVAANPQLTIKGEA